MLRRRLLQRVNAAPPARRDNPPRRDRLTRLLVSEEAIYGLVLVSAMIVVSGSLVGTSANALFTVVVTVLVFFAAHVYAGTIARLAAGGSTASLRAGFTEAVRHSQGMLVVAVVPVLVLLLGVLRIVDDEAAVWSALGVDIVFLAALGWFVVSRWTRRLWPRVASGLITAAFGVVIMALKALVHH